MKVATSVVMGREPTIPMRKEQDLSKIKQLVPDTVDEFDEIPYAEAI